MFGDSRSPHDYFAKSLCSGSGWKLMKKIGDYHSYEVDATQTVVSSSVSIVPWLASHRAWKAVGTYAASICCQLSRDGVDVVFSVVIFPRVTLDTD